MATRLRALTRPSFNSNHLLEGERGSVLPFNLPGYYPKPLKFSVSRLCAMHLLHSLRAWLLCDREILGQRSLVLQPIREIQQAAQMTVCQDASLLGLWAG